MTLRPLCITLAAMFLAAPVSSAQGPAPIPEAYRATADRIIQAALADSGAYRRLQVMTETFGNRLSGSPALERTIDWILTQMKKDSLQQAHTERVMVPHWVRGTESAQLLLPREAPLPMLGLGGSIGTPPDGITARVLVVTSFDDLTAHAAQARGKIVLFNAPFVSYGQTVVYRTQGAQAAAKVGAVASLIRSITPYSMRTPHTGVMYYDSTGKIKKIPHAAITPEDADMLQHMQERGEPILLKLKMNARTLPDAPSRNVMAQLTGSEKPNEVVVMGGHIDSWDVGRGAMDDGGGIMVAWQALNLLKRLGLTPKRTIRVVGWVNEENGARGGAAYPKAHAGEQHVLAIESDGGVFKPHGFGFTGPDAARATVQQIGSLLAGIGADSIGAGGGGTDIEALMATGVPGMGLNVDGTRYFWFHHSDADTIDKLDPHEMALCVATMAVMAYVVAMEGLPK
ncbi:MAG TPA: M28 family metallopeptidase [Gemmatimonadales bacterium]